MENTKFKKKIVNETAGHIENLVDIYGYGWELYIKCDTHGNVRFNPKGEVWLENGTTKL